MDTFTKQLYNGKCQYKTGKCFNERTRKRNGEAHSLCEEHRLKQNMIQRRSDRKYQTVHAIRRRERSQRRAVIKRQVSMAVAQQLFYEHQQQKSIASQLDLTMENASSPSQNSLLQPSEHDDVKTYTSAEKSSAQCQLVLDPEHLHSRTKEHSFISLQGHYSTTTFSDMTSNHVDDKLLEDGTPTGVDDFMPESFLSVCIPEEIDAFTSVVPLLSAIGEKQSWTDDDIDFLQDLLL
uniref:Uncharacterized protein AlNc14C22G2222 n=1 Tax=Albugo laibachii Nc14 TaxID=890382 RepID=F0W5Q7_9STRA|nr:conserved hypothetical protein [Albugo laibachii Nc14]|eukprot:CCA16448.1 conserved hypothetical protein [Albugo laibachii Nc14]